MRTNPIGHTIFLISEEYRVTNQKTDTIFFTSEKIRIVFSRLSGRPCEVTESECLLQSMLSQNHGFKVCRHQFSGTIYRGARKRKYKNVALLEEFLTLRNESRHIEEIAPKELNAYIAEFIITVRKKDGNEDYEPSSLRSLMASFERYLKKKNYGFSIMKDAEFEQARKALQSKQKDLKQKGKGNTPNASVALTEEEIKLLSDKELLGTSTPEAQLNTIWFNNTIHFGLRGCKHGVRNTEICVEAQAPQAHNAIIYHLVREFKVAPYSFLTARELVSKSRDGASFKKSTRKSRVTSTTTSNSHRSSFSNHRCSFPMC